MLAANIDHNVRAVREIHPVHQLVANRAWHVADSELTTRVLGQRTSDTKHRGLLFPIHANLLEGSGIGPDALATRALAQFCVSYYNLIHIHPAAWATLSHGSGNFGSGGRRAAM
jgi:hypothetical protein